MLRKLRMLYIPCLKESKLIFPISDYKALSLFKGETLTNIIFKSRGSYK